MGEVEKMGQNYAKSPASTNPKISLIATFFNASAYLDRCVMSLVSQSYKDYEVLLVDDGSSDDTFARLQLYACENRVRSLHKENGGAGSARNFGVSQARGDFISFVDGDDFISPFYLEMLDAALREHACEWAIGAHQVVRESEIQGIVWSDAFSSNCLNKHKAVEMLAYNEITESPCGKLIPRWVYEKNPFPERYYEDVAIAGEHILALGNVAYFDTPIYAYLMRPGSVVHRNSAEMRQLIDFKWAIERFVSPLEEAYPQYATALSYRRALECARAHSLAMRTKGDSAAIRAIDEELIDQIRLTISILKQDHQVQRAQLLRFRVLVMAPKLYDFIFAMYEKLRKVGEG